MGPIATALLVSAVLREPPKKDGTVRLVVYSRGREVGRLVVPFDDAEPLRARLLDDPEHSRCAGCAEWVRDDQAAHDPGGAAWCRRCNDERTR